MEAKRIFRLDDIVYVISYGWGIVIDAGCSTHNGWVGIETNSGKIISVDSHLVSFSKYTLEGFSQERPEVLPNKGDIVWIRGEFPDEWTVGHFFKKEDGKYYISYSPALKGWHTFGIEYKTTNPYKPIK